MRQTFRLMGYVRQVQPKNHWRGRARSFCIKLGLATWVLGSALTLVSGCADTGSAGIEGTGDRAVTVSGTVTSFGSIWVNGVRVATESAEIYRDGQPITEAQLQPGMVVQLTARAANQEAPVAQRIDTETLLRGPITSVSTLDSSRRALRVLGQTLVITEDSVLGDASPSQWVPGDWIAASGLLGRDGVALGTYLDAADELDGVVLTGVVSALDQANSQLELSQQGVDYHQATFVRGEADALALGAKVRLRGAIDSAGRLQAQEVAILPRPDLGDAGAQVALEGLITHRETAGQFTLQGYDIEMESASFRRGIPDHLDIGARVSLLGTVADTGAVRAQEIYVIYPAENRLVGPVEAIDWQAGQLTVLGNTLSVDALTIYRDRGPQGNRRLNFQAINEGDTVELFKRPSAVSGPGTSGVVTRLERLSDSGQVLLKGPVAMMLSDYELQLLGVVVDLSGLDPLADGQELEAGTFVTVTGLQTGPDSMQASSITVHSHPACLAPVHVACDMAGPSQPPEKPVAPIRNGDNESP